MKSFVVFAAIFAFSNAGVIIKDTLVQTPVGRTDIVGPSGSIHTEDVGTVAVRTAIPTAPLIAPAPVIAPTPVPFVPAVAPVIRTAYPYTPLRTVAHFPVHYSTPVYRHYGYPTYLY